MLVVAITSRRRSNGCSANTRISVSGVRENTMVSQLSPAWSDLVARFAADTQLVPPPYYPATWPIRFGALGVPIDNMFTRGGARIEAIEAMDDPLGSNHRGLLATVGLYAD